VSDTPLLASADVRRRRAQRARVAALLVLAPVCGEYLAAYDDSTGRPLALVGALLIFVPLYGAPALLIRELARRRGAGWRGVVGLAAAAGLLQAGVIDQSLFSESYRGLDTWAAWQAATRIPGTGVSAHMLLAFVGGHVACTFAAPIALVEALDPPRRTAPWVGGRGLAIALAFYAAAAALVLADHLQTERSHAAPAQVAGALVAAAALGAWSLRRREPAAPADRHPAPHPIVVGAVAFVVAAGVTMASETWRATLASLAAIAGAGTWVVRASRAGGWTARHDIALATGALLSRAALAFTYAPLFGDVEAWRKYAHNVAMLVLVCAVAALAWRAARPPAPVT
jgi:hypothetical protein